MKITQHGRTATIEIEDYGDLLACRALPEWHFVDETTVETTVDHLHSAGLTDERQGDIEWLEPASYLFDYQRWCVDLALDRERFAIFSLTGSGKTEMQLEWARQVTHYHKGRTLMLAPILVCPQTIEEAHKFYGDELLIADLRERDALNEWLQSGSGIGITNYEKIDGTTSTLPVDAVAIDEASVLKASMGSRRTAIIKAFKGVRWKLCASATPAPNDRVEYAEQAFFLDVVRSTREFLAAFFVNRDGEWQLKGHGADAFYRHLALVNVGRFPFGEGRLNQLGAAVGALADVERAGHHHPPAARAAHVEAHSAASIARHVSISYGPHHDGNGGVSPRTHRERISAASVNSPSSANDGSRIPCRSALSGFSV